MADAQPDTLPIIAYIDEVADERDNFYADAHATGLFGDIVLIEPDEELETLIVKLLELKIDALVTDFNLSEEATISYDGGQVVKALLEIRHDFPSFIRTSFDDQALNESDDVNRIYSKNANENKDRGRELFERVVLQINHYRTRVETWQAEFDELLAVSPEDRSASQIERLVELDSWIEASIGKDQGVSKHAKAGIFNRESLYDKELQLIEETEKLIADMKKALGE